jgi:hypothetical protein
LDANQQALRYAAGRWLVTDGDRVTGSVILGYLAIRDGNVRLEYNADKL